jgi:DNA helicase-2/ATP-dependent DNA helicase PcrA
VQEASILDGLTDAQRDAATHFEGPALVLAGPGSGKTRVITRRIAWLVSQGVPPWSILAVTFTNKAASEMRRRVEDLLPRDLPGRRGLVTTTFHSFAARFLREHAEAAGLPQDFAIFDAADQREAMKRAIAEAEIATSQWNPAQTLHAISDRKNALETVDQFAKVAVDWRERTLVRLWRAYEQALARSKALDFDDLLLRTALLLKRDENVRAATRERFQHLLIDEYQDTNQAQFTIANAIAGDGGNLFAVGDPDQSIYGWRGADLSNILEFERHYPRARTIPLGRNFRSTRRIVDAAAALIGHNRQRKEKRIYSELDEGETPKVVRCLDEHHEAETVAAALEQASIDGTPFRSMAILYRINALSRVLEEVLRRRGIPYVIARGTAFYERKEVKDALAYLRLVANPADEISLRRIVNNPPRGLGDTTLKRVATWSLDEAPNLFEGLARAGEIEGLTKRAVSAASKFTGLVRRWREAAHREPPEALGDLVSTVLRESGLEARFSGPDEEDAQRRANLGELVSAAAEWEMPEDVEAIAPPDVAATDATDDAAVVEASTGDDLDELDLLYGLLPDEPAPSSASPPDPDDPPNDSGEPTLMDALRRWLESVTLVSDADAIDPEKGSVTLLTLHAAKGLEFPFVAMVGLEQGLFPSQRADSSEDQLEEERRLCFVGMTRAERRLLMTSAELRTVRGLTQRTVESQFLSEIPADGIERSGRPAGRGADRWGGETWGRPAAGGDDDAGAADAGPRIEYDADYVAEHGGSLAKRFPVGTLVRHARFGMGRIEAVLPRGRATSVRVDFRNLGAKTLVLEYAKLERVL